jgi:uncharacterized protein with von Willebrand factor type A (vWA) domain
VEVTARPAPAGRPAALHERVLAFCGLLRRMGFGVTSGRIIDAFRALDRVSVQRRDEFRLALRTNLVSSRDEELLFDRVFESFWDGAPDVEMAARELNLEPRSDDRNEEIPDEPPDVLGSPRRYSRDELRRRKALLGQWPGESPEMRRLLRDLLASLATRPSRRRRPARNGARIDLRRTLRRNVRHGLDVVDLARTDRKVRKTRLVLVCDVSGSMDTYNPFLLQLMFGVQKGLKNSRTIVFSTRSTEITRMLRHQSVAHTLAGIGQTAQHWSGGTDIGAALAQVNREVLRDGSASSTVAVVISDGYDQGDPAVVRREMEALRRRTRVVVWINPLLGTEGYAPIAQGMRAALPYIDHFLPAHDLTSLRGLCRALVRV